MPGRNVDVVAHDQVNSIGTNRGERIGREKVEVTGNGVSATPPTVPVYVHVTPLTVAEDDPLINPLVVSSVMVAPPTLAAD